MIIWTTISFDCQQAKDDNGCVSHLEDSHFRCRIEYRILLVYVLTFFQRHKKKKSESTWINLLTKVFTFTKIEVVVHEYLTVELKHLMILVTSLPFDCFIHRDILYTINTRSRQRLQTGYDALNYGSLK